MDEEKRLQVVKQFERLDLSYNKELKETIATAAKICETSNSAITIIDDDTVWSILKTV